MKKIGIYLYCCWLNKYTFIGYITLLLFPWFCYLLGTTDFYSMNHFILSLVGVVIDFLIAVIFLGGTRFGRETFFRYLFLLEHFHNCKNLLRWPTKYYSYDVAYKALRKKYRHSMMETP